MCIGLFQTNPYTLHSVGEAVPNSLRGGGGGLFREGTLIRKLIWAEKGLLSGRAQELCESGGGRRGLHAVPNSAYGLCGTSNIEEQSSGAV